jgi:protoporphyrin/coproporphyrin ferrochelatase
MTDKKTAIVLFQFGGPDSLEAIEPFLFNLFIDPDIIDFPGAFFVRKLLAKYISNRRSTKIIENYKHIGGKSPILDITQQQVSSLESLLQTRDMNARVFIAMRYWNPTIKEVAEKVKSGGFEQIILLPLYPQFSQATTLSSINEWKRQIKIQECNIPTKLVCCYPSQPLYIEAVVERINSALARFQNITSTDIDLIFSAHGIPLSYIKHGDPYKMQIEETVRCIVERGKWNSPHTLCYQSRVGPAKWLRPSLKEMVKHLASNNRRHLLIIPVAFVTDNIETLYEINVDVRKHAMMQGIQQFELAPALNNHPKFIQCLAELVHTQLSSEVNSNTCEILWNRKEKRTEPKMCPCMK